MKIYEFSNETTAQACLAQVNELGATLFEGLGYTVERDEQNKPYCIGKNAQTGDDVLNAKTTTWDVVKTSPAGTYYFTSVFENRNITAEQATATTAQLQQAFGFVEKELAVEWVYGGEAF